MMTDQAEVYYWLQIGPTKDLGNCDTDMKLKPAFTFKLVSPFPAMNMYAVRNVCSYQQYT